MIAPYQMALVGGQRALTPLATVAMALTRGEFSLDKGISRFFSNPIIAVGTLALAVAEMAGDKQKGAPDRIVPVGLAARFLTSAITGAILAPRRNYMPVALASGAISVAASYPGWALRVWTMKRYGQNLTGFIEDALVIASAAAIMRNRMIKRD